ncbi:MAG: hypothetical protein HYU66_26650 [Armatimonadetes bacterium]|nr:hypothetical protein [Armatimonadota bacterium]
MLKLVLKLLGGVLEVAFLLVICCTPLTAVWLVSSLAAYLGGPRWTSLAAGLALCPVLPLVWEAHSLYLRHKRKAAPRTWLFERLAFRVFGLSLVFLVCLLAAFPRAGFLALSTRGDWMLDTAWVRSRVAEPRRQQARHALLKCADGLEWLYSTVSPNRYKGLVDDRFRAGTPEPDEAPPQPQPQPPPGQDTGTTPPQPGEDTGTKPPTPAPAPTPAPTPPPPAVWPAKSSDLSPAVASMPPVAETSLDTVAEYLAHEGATPAGRWWWATRATRTAKSAPAATPGTPPSSTATGT